MLPLQLQAAGLHGFCDILRSKLFFTVEELTCLVFFGGVTRLFVWCRGLK